jgi:hypothetical protein
VSAPRYFGGDSCETTGHQPGDRHRYPHGLDDEWDGQAWAPVCPTCDVAMRDRDPDGWLRCGHCLTLYVNTVSPS